MIPFHSTSADHTSTRAVKETLPAPQTQTQRLFGVHIALLCHPLGAIQGDTLPCWRSSLQNGTQALPVLWGGVSLSPAASPEQKGKGSSRLGHAGDAHCQASRPAAGVDPQYRGADCHVWMPLWLHLPEGPAGRCFLGQGHGRGQTRQSFSPLTLLLNLSFPGPVWRIALFTMSSAYVCQNKQTKIS